MTTRTAYSIIRNPNMPDLTTHVTGTELNKILSSLNATRVIQGIQTTESLANVQTYLAACSARGMKAAIAFATQPVYSGGVWNIDHFTNLIVPIASHAGFMGVVQIYDEPGGDGIINTQLAELYTAVKVVLPTTSLMVGYSNELYTNEGTSKQFAAGCCDIAMIGSMPFQRVSGVKTNLESTVLTAHTTARTVIAARAPSTTLWTNVQVFGGSGAYWMPGLRDLRSLLKNVVFDATLEAIKPIDRVWWQTWASDVTSLRSNASFRLRELVLARTIDET